MPFNEVQDADSVMTFYPISEEILHCNITSLNDTHSYNDSGMCGVSWDGVSCWPITPSGTTAKLPCFAELNGVKYDVSGNASRECFKNATWSSWSNYRSCTPLVIPEDEYLQVLWDMRDAVTVYYVGYTLSLVALTVALWIFLYFKDLRCIRNTIHANLMFTYFFLDITWILTARLQSSQEYVSSRAACYLTIFLTYLMGTNFFWMFVEGLYLFILVVKTFSVDNIKMYVYALIGWAYLLSDMDKPLITGHTSPQLNRAELQQPETPMTVTTSEPPPEKHSRTGRTIRLLVRFKDYM
ncbi:diuretic hormone receptor-like [Uloborus diversus]|uniref:diuretic hormone receptor-like n=1 Tax=Uloborus diversus TaxID=327109 RepID=UPI002409D05E|nr:diuretic hormone receptor-like [Uloborus diversus]